MITPEMLDRLLTEVVAVREAVREVAVGEH
jgi:hypothetical protein